MNEKNEDYQQIYDRADDVMMTEEPAQKARYFKTLGLSSFIYAVIYTICMFQNSSGITMPVWVGATILYACQVMKALYIAGEDIAVEEQEEKDAKVQQKEFHLKAGSRIYIVIMLLLGISTFLTDNDFIIICNYFGFFMMLPAFLLHNYYDDSKWKFGKNLTEIAASIFGAISCMLTPFSDANAFWKEKKQRENKTVRAVLVGIAIAAPCVLLLGACLADADAIFQNLVERMFSGLRIPMNVFQIFLMLLFGFFSAYCGMRFLALHSRNEEKREIRKLEPIIAVTFTGVLAVMYLIFCGIQIVYLFAGHMRPLPGMTYASYARSGFFQLLFVSIVNFVMVLVIHKYFDHRKVLDLMLLVICACTFVMIASSAYRMILYIDTYHLTFLRVLVLAALAALTFLTIGAVCSLFRTNFPLFRYSMIVVSVVYLTFSFSHVDYFIASYNLAQIEGDGSNVDWWYLGSMSMDAAPAIADYYAKAPAGVQTRMDQYAVLAKYWAEDEGTYDMDGKGDAKIEKLLMEVQAETGDEGWFGDYMQKMCEIEKNLGWRNFNVSRYRAVQLLMAHYQNFP